MPVCTLAHSLLAKATHMTKPKQGSLVHPKGKREGSEYLLNNSAVSQEQS